MLFKLKRSALVLLACASPAQAFNIQFDYTYDTSGFFSGNNVARRTVLEAAASQIENQLAGVSLAAIDPYGVNHWTFRPVNPTTGATLSLADVAIPENTMKVFVGARNLPGDAIGLANPGGYGAEGPWYTQFSARNTATHYEPFGGSISFDSKTDWYFDADTSTFEDFGDREDFYSVVQHELTHLLGFSDGSRAFKAKTSSTGYFTGKNAVQLFGGNVPLSLDRSHFKEDLTFQGSGLVMDPSLPTGTRLNLGPLEYAVLKDIGLGNVQHASTAILTVVVNTVNQKRAGSVTAGYEGATTHDVGEKISILAIPDAGYSFSHWSGGIQSTSNPLKFAMSEKLSVTANFVLKPKTPVSSSAVARYYGIFADGVSPSTKGGWRLTVNPTGVYSGSFTLNGRLVSLTGKFDASGHSSKTFVVGGESAQVSLDKDPVNGTITGELIVHGNSATFRGDKLPVYTDASPCPLRGIYTVLLAPESLIPIPVPPQGSGYAVVNIETFGNVMLSGKLPNDSGLTMSASMVDGNRIPFSVSLATKRDSLEGMLTFDLDADSSDLLGDIYWNCLSTSQKGAAWKDGFSTTLSAVGSRWVRPEKGKRVLTALEVNGGKLDVGVSLDGGDLFDGHVTVNTANVLTEVPPSPQKVRVFVTPTSGQFSGTFWDTSVSPSTGRTFSGVILQKKGWGRGYFLKRTGITTVAGEISLNPTP
ncbi:MAG: hypothetical protein WCO60_16620 [Verrucomicrobiota bacterium]